MTGEKKKVCDVHKAADCRLVPILAPLLPFSVGGILERSERSKNKW